MPVAACAGLLLSFSPFLCRSLRITELVGSRVKEVGSVIRFSRFSSSVSETLSLNKDTKVKRFMDDSDQTDKIVKKGDKMEKTSVDIEFIRTDPSRLDSMTVEELRKLTRSVGISTKGRKKDLVSALRAFLMKMEKATGTSSLSISEDISSTAMSAKRKAETSVSEDNAENSITASEVSPQTAQKKNRRKQVVETISVRGDNRILVNKQEVSIKSEVVGMQTSRTSRRMSSKVQSNTLVIDQTGPSVNLSEPWTVLAHKKPCADWVPYNPRTMRPPPLSRDAEEFTKLVSWNVNGLRALLKLESFSALQLAQKEDFDVLCLQETKLQEKDVEEIRDCLIDGYDNSFWTCSVSKLGYSGTAIISRIKPLSVKYGIGKPDHDDEGRLVTIEFDKYYLLSGYVPNSGDGLRRLTYRVKEWDPSLSNYMKDLERSKPVILTGDLNCAHEEIDIFNPSGNRRSAGFTDEERKSFEANFLSRGFVDTFRKQHPGVVGYTYWGYRHGGRKTNKGWRLDYFLVSESIADRVYDSYILPEIMGSDHCPIGLILKH